MKKRPPTHIPVRIEWEVVQKVRESASKNRRTFQSEVNVLLGQALAVTATNQTPSPVVAIA